MVPRLENITTTCKNKLEDIMVYLCKSENAYSPFNKKGFCTIKDPGCRYYTQKNKRCKKDPRELTRKFLINSQIIY